jgi:hypothetical protein
MTYGRWLDEGHRALVGAHSALLRASAGDYPHAAEVVGERDRCLAALLRNDPVTHEGDELVKLGRRLPGLADTVDTITRQVVQRGALLARKPTINSSAAAFGTASSWAIAAHADAQ